jgi:anti-sigma-K factor RskA
VLAGLCLMLWQQNKQLLGDLREARRVAADFERERLHVLGLVNVLSSPDTVTVKLASTTPADAAQVGGVVRYNQRLGSVVYSAELPTLPSGKIYQMWLVPKSGTPISAGTFADGRPGKNVLSAAVPPNTEPKAFAVTIEPAGGVPQPTGKMILLGAS